MPASVYSEEQCGSAQLGGPNGGENGDFQNRTGDTHGCLGVRKGHLGVPEVFFGLAESYFLMSNEAVKV